MRPRASSVLVRTGLRTCTHLRAVCTGGTGQLALGGGSHGAYAVRVPASGVPYVPRAVATQVTPGCFSRNLIKCPCVVVWGTFVAAIVVAAIPLVSGR